MPCATHACCVAFSGGRDSSLVLAAAVRAAAHEGVAPPIAADLPISVRLRSRASGVAGARARPPRRREPGRHRGDATSSTSSGPVATTELSASRCPVSAERHTSSHSAAAQRRQPARRSRRGRVPRQPVAGSTSTTCLPAGVDLSGATHVDFAVASLPARCAGADPRTSEARRSAVAATEAARERATRSRRRVSNQPLRFDRAIAHEMRSRALLESALASLERLGQRVRCSDRGSACSIDASLLLSRGPEELADGATAQRRCALSRAAVLPDALLVPTRQGGVRHGPSTARRRGASPRSGAEAGSTRRLVDPVALAARLARARPPCSDRSAPPARMASRPRLGERRPTRRSPRRNRPWRPGDFRL